MRFRGKIKIEWGKKKAVITCLVIIAIPIAALLLQGLQKLLK
jgi:hypothetical protein